MNPITALISSALISCIITFFALFFTNSLLPPSRSYREFVLRTHFIYDERIDIKLIRRNHAIKLLVGGLSFLLINIILHNLSQ